MVALTTGDSTPVIATRRRQGIKRSPRERYAASLGLDERRLAVLAQLTEEETIKVATIATALGLPYAGVNATLYTLQDRGLVERVPYRGWKLTGRTC